MKNSLLIVLLLFLMVVNGCQQQSPKVVPAVITIRLQPFNDIPAEQVNYVATELRKIYPAVVVSAKIPFPDHVMNALGYRYRADSLIKYLSSIAGKNEIVLGLTGMDISTTIHGSQDWGIFGLEDCPGNSCIASSFRLQHSAVQNFFKVAVHEIGHNEGLPHCPVKTCFMRDAEGGSPMGEETGFCDRCKAYLKNKTWKL